MLIFASNNLDSFLYQESCETYSVSLFHDLTLTMAESLYSWLDGSLSDELHIYLLAYQMNDGLVV